MFSCAVVHPLVDQLLRSSRLFCRVQGKLPSFDTCRRFTSSQYYSLAWFTACWNENELRYSTAPSRVIRTTGWDDMWDPVWLINVKVILKLLISQIWISGSPAAGLPANKSDLQIETNRANQTDFCFYLTKSGPQIANQIRTPKKASKSSKSAYFF